MFLEKFAIPFDDIAKFISEPTRVIIRRESLRQKDEYPAYLLTRTRTPRSEKLISFQNTELSFPVRDSPVSPGVPYPRATLLVQLARSSPRKVRNSVVPATKHAFASEVENRFRCSRLKSRAGRRSRKSSVPLAVKYPHSRRCWLQ